MVSTVGHQQSLEELVWYRLYGFAIVLKFGQDIHGVRAAERVLKGVHGARDLDPATCSDCFAKLAFAC